LYIIKWQLNSERWLHYFSAATRCLIYVYVCKILENLKASDTIDIFNPRDINIFINVKYGTNMLKVQGGVFYFNPIFKVFLVYMQQRVARRLQRLRDILYCLLHTMQASIGRADFLLKNPERFAL